MSLELAFLTGGSVLLFAGLAGEHLSRTPLTRPMVYLLAGVTLGPTILHWFHFNPLRGAHVLEIITEIAVLISLFTAGMKMPLPLRWSRWQQPVRLAVFGMMISVALMTGFLSIVMGMSLGAAILLAAILAPTDPVLATEVQARHPGDRERLRFGLTSEGGLNDGTAFPFVMLGLGLLGAMSFDSLIQWVWSDILLATVLAIIIGWCCAGALALAVFVLRSHPRAWDLKDDFLGLGLIGLVYGLCLVVDAWGFLGVFFAALSLRHYENQLSTRPCATQSGVAPGVSRASLAFKEQLERLCEVALVLLIGFTLFLDSWSWRAVGIGAFLFLVARPISVYLCLVGLRLPPRVRGMTAWFGVRGIGSLYYMSYAVNHGISEALALELIHITLVVVTLSILVHGLSLRPLMQRFGRHNGGRPKRRRTDRPHREADVSVLPFGYRFASEPLAQAYRQTARQR